MSLLQQNVDSPRLVTESTWLDSAPTATWPHWPCQWHLVTDSTAVRWHHIFLSVRRCQGGLLLYLRLFWHPDSNLPDGRAVPRQTYIRGLVLSWTRKTDSDISLTLDPSHTLTVGEQKCLSLAFGMLWFRNRAATCLKFKTHALGVPMTFLCLLQIRYAYGSVNATLRINGNELAPSLPPRKTACNTHVCWVINNSAKHFPILLKVGRLELYGPP